MTQIERLAAEYATLSRTPIVPGDDTARRLAQVGRELRAARRDALRARLAVEPAVAWDRAETDPCEAGTPGCSVLHARTDSPCQPW